MLKYLFIGLTWGLMNGQVGWAICTEEWTHKQPYKEAKTWKRVEYNILEVVLGWFSIKELERGMIS
jgi:hypothetical protein